MFKNNILIPGSPSCWVQYRRDWIHQILSRTQDWRRRQLNIHELQDVPPFSHQYNQTSTVNDSVNLVVNHSTFYCTKNLIKRFIHLNFFLDKIFFQSRGWSPVSRMDQMAASELQATVASLGTNDGVNLS